jgi:hypothetical protein
MPIVIEPQYNPGTTIGPGGMGFAPPTPTYTPNIVSDPYSSFTDEDMYRDVSFPTQAMADAYDYGYGQKIGNLYDANTGTIPSYAYDGYSVNPNVFANVYGGGPDGPYNRGAKLLAEQYNNPSITNNFDYVGPQQDVLDIIAFNNALQAGEIDVDPMYMDEDMTYNISDPELYMTQEEQVADEPNAFVKTLMENYGRGNPFMQDLSGTYDNYFGETFGMDEDQVGLRDVVNDIKIATEKNADMIEEPTLEMYPLEPVKEIDLMDEQFDGANLGNYDLFHLMQNGYSLEEAQAILTEQGLA